EQPPEEPFADIDLGRVFLARTRHDANAGISKQVTQISLNLPDFLDVHRAAPPPPRTGQMPTSYTIWFIVREGSAQPASPMTFAGTPATVTLFGTSLTTAEPLATPEQWPPSVFPSICRPSPIVAPY